MIPYQAACDSYNLHRAWMEVRGKRTSSARHQGAGVDGVTIADWETASEARLQALQSDLLSGAYRPSPLLAFDIPRRSTEAAGGHGAPTRRLGIPTVTDRVAQRAVKNLLEPVWEGVFLSCSHGFRPDRSVFTAIAHVLWHEARGRDWVADADIEACFDNIPHDRLLARVTTCADAPLVELVASWLEAGAITPGRGVAQGAVLSPLLANIYLHSFDVAMIEAGWSLVRYADDWVVMCQAEAEAANALDHAAEILHGLDLALNPAKTGVVPFGPGFRFLGAEFWH